MGFREVEMYPENAGNESARGIHSAIPRVKFTAMFAPAAITNRALTACRALGIGGL
jgi:hypothetical protein